MQYKRLIAPVVAMFFFVGAGMAYASTGSSSEGYSEGSGSMKESLKEQAVYTAQYNKEANLYEHGAYKSNDSYKPNYGGDNNQWWGNPDQDKDHGKDRGDYKPESYPKASGYQQSSGNATVQVAANITANVYVVAKTESNNQSAFAYKRPYNFVTPQYPEPKKEEPKDKHDGDWDNKWNGWADRDGSHGDDHSYNKDKDRNNKDWGHGNKQDEKDGDRGDHDYNKDNDRHDKGWDHEDDEDGEEDCR